LPYQLSIASNGSANIDADEEFIGIRPAMALVNNKLGLKGISSSSSKGGLPGPRGTEKNHCL
jgi:hypothetical protein